MVDSGAQSCTPVHDMSLSTDTTATTFSPIQPLVLPCPCPHCGVGIVLANATTSIESPLESSTQPKDGLPTGLLAVGATEQQITSISLPVIVNPL